MNHRLTPRCRRPHLAAVMLCVTMIMLCAAPAGAADDANAPHRHADEAQPDRTQADRPRPLERLREWRQRHPPDGEHHPRRRPLDRDEVHQLLGVLHDVNPDLHAKLARALENNPRRAHAVMPRIYSRLEHLIDMKANDPQHYKLRTTEMRCKIDAFKLKVRIRHAQHDGNDARVAHLRRELHDVVEKHFEVRQALREHELHELEQRIDRLRDELAEHRRRKDELVREHVERLLAHPGRGPDHPPDEVDDPPHDRPPPHHHRDEHERRIHTGPNDG